MFARLRLSACAQVVCLRLGAICGLPIGGGRESRVPQRCRAVRRQKMDVGWRSQANLDSNE